MIMVYHCSSIFFSLVDNQYPRYKNTNINPILLHIFTEYGILQSLNCKKIMRLNPDDPDDLHYLHKNGMLYVAGKDPYDTESYCIENVINPQDSTEVKLYE